MWLVLLIVLAVVVLSTGAGLVVARRGAARREAAGRTAAEAPADGRGAGPGVREREAPPAPVSEAPDAVEPAPAAPTDLAGTAPAAAAPAPAPEPAAVSPPVPILERPRLRDRLGKVRALLSEYLGDLRGRGAIDDETWDGLEEALIRADVGVAATGRILDDLRRRVKESGAGTADELLDLLKEDLVAQMAAADRSLRQVPGEANVWMFVGVNGVGKTTSIGKLAQREVAAGRRVVLAAGDTFRAAAAEQLELWSERVGADLVRGQDGADPGSVVFDAMAAAGSRRADLVLVDTAGRLHTKVNLMEELKKLRRIVERTPGACKEVLLVIDATTGQNGLTQARQFAEAVDVTGVILTKLDGTAKGGIVLAVQSELGIPVKLVGVGESAADLVDFDPAEFVDALFS